ncbi:MAG TPA: RsmB/NOP family class I SAM-dependent RNA methyltransferase [Alphaproteobacteria bacterium]|nr:RsmB/NOP family class I SAM-dependent RNA methyltransferase [Alphaproteobacteria bacterium]
MKNAKLPLNNPLVKRYNMLGCSCKPIDLKPSLRVNTLKISEKELVSRLKAINVKLTKIPFTTHGYYYSSKFSLGATSEYLQGFYYIQEAASQLPPQVLDPKPGEIVLDMCAAPGSKTTQIGMYMQNKGTIVALDADPRRLLAVRNNLDRCGVTNGLLYKKDSRFVFDLGMQFDKVLLDAPCTGNYVIEEDFFIKKSVHGIRERARLQRELLKAAVKVLKKGGVLVYSTCSLEPEENEMNVDWILTKHPELKLEETGLDIGDPGLTNVFGEKLNPELKKTRRFWPEKTGTEGFYIAKIVKTK